MGAGAAGGDRVVKARLAFVLIWLLCAVAAVVGLTWLAFAVLRPSRRAWQIAIGFDQTANATFGGDPDWTISARSWSNRQRQPYKALRRCIDWAAAAMGDHDHCERAYLEEKKGCLTKSAN